MSVVGVQSSWYETDAKGRSLATVESTGAQCCAMVDVATTDSQLFGHEIGPEETEACCAHERVLWMICPDNVGADCWPPMIVRGRRHGWIAT